MLTLACVEKKHHVICFTKGVEREKARGGLSLPRDISWTLTYLTAHWTNNNNKAIQCSTFYLSLSLCQANVCCYALNAKWTLSPCVCVYILNSLIRLLYKVRVSRSTTNLCFVCCCFLGGGGTWKTSTWKSRAAPSDLLEPPAPTLVLTRLPCTWHSARVELLWHSKTLESIQREVVGEVFISATIENKPL